MTILHLILEASSSGLANTSASAFSKGKNISIKSFSAYCKQKGKQWKERVTKVPEKEKEEDVAIVIGLMEYSEKESKMKPVRGKRVMLRVSNKALYADVLKLAEAKFKAYHCNYYKEAQKYCLLYESGKDAQFLPGTTEFFSLKRYREEIGKDYKCIVLYLCTYEDFLASEGLYDIEQEEEEECYNSPEKKRKTTSNQTETQVKSDEMLARQLQSELDDTVTEDKVSIDQSSHEIDLEKVESFTDKQSNQESIKFDSLSSLITSLKTKVNSKEQFYMVVRRGSDILRCLTIWQREAKKHPPECTLRVHFAGEEGIDSGAMAREFLTHAFDHMRSQMFQNGAPTDSMLYAHNGFFCACGQISVVSIVQGGPPPCLFEECVYNMLVNQEVDMTKLSAHEHLTEHERELLDNIKIDPKAEGLQDIIVGHGYSGPINADHVDDITGTITLSIVTNRLVYLKEFKRGLNYYGLLDILQDHADLCKELFLLNTSSVDANYVVSLLRPQYSEGGTVTRTVEEKLFDHLHDFIMSIEDTTVTGHIEELAYDHEDTEDKAGGKHNVEEVQETQVADISPSGMLGWLTGQKHRPVDGDQLLIYVNFDHKCHERMPNHKICFPIVGACARSLTLPVAHMQAENEFKRIMLLAFTKGQAFGRN